MPAGRCRHGSFSNRSGKRRKPGRHELRFVVRRLGRAERPRARETGARTVNLAALATGFGPLLMQDFASALRQALTQDWTPLEVLRVVVRHEEEAAKIRQVLAESEYGKV